jgi:hypothetical protein
LRSIREQDRVQLEEQYRGKSFFVPNFVAKADLLTLLVANEEALRAELQEARVRAESAETQLQFEQRQRQMGGMATAGHDPLPYPYFPSPAPPVGLRVPEPYFAADVNGGNQYYPYRENHMPYEFRENFQNPPPYQPNQYQRPQNSDNWQIMRDLRDPWA